MDALTVKLWRWDREPDSEHYGPTIDPLLEDLAGGPGHIDRSRYVTERKFPGGKVFGTDIDFELHEDGPVIPGVPLDQIANLITAIAGLVTAWVAWRST